MKITRQQIVNARGHRNHVDPHVPYHVLEEEERQADGRLQNVLTVFLTNRECPFRCLMCDLWKNTTTTTVPSGAIPAQIEFALQNTGNPECIKLYNSGNFFDRKAIPVSDHREIAGLLQPFQRVIVENHPRLCGHDVVRFRDRISGQLEVAMGLETSHAPTLALLNKQMTTDDFAKACEFLKSQQIDLRTFVLVRPPDTTEQQGIQRAIESVRFALDCGVNCVAIIPTRPGNGIMEMLQAAGRFQPPRLSSIETVMEVTVPWRRGRIFADLWDLQQFSHCSNCATQRIARLHTMNQTQTVPEAVRCEACNTGVPD